jgi:hypothetical protein
MNGPISSWSENMLAKSRKISSCGLTKLILAKCSQFFSRIDDLFDVT